MKRILLIIVGLSVAIFADFSRDNIAQIVTDNTTELQWQDDEDAKNISKNWKDAIVYCEALELGGYSNWRLPNFNELYYIADRSKSSPAIDNTFQNVVSDYYWSSTTVVGRESNAWRVDFSSGNDSWNNKSNSNYIRCVRDGQ